MNQSFFILKNKAYNIGIKSSVISVLHSSPPMIAAAREPNMASDSRGIIQRSHHDRAETTLGTVYQCGDRFRSFIDLKGDLIHQHNAVFYQHADQSQCADDGHEVEDFSCEQHDCYHPYEYHRDAAEDDDGLAVVLEQYDQDGNHQDDG